MLYLYIQGALLERRPPYLGSLGLCETICLYLVFLLSTQSYCCSLQVHLFFLCHITFESLPQEAKLNVDQCLAPFAESRTKLTGENLWNWKSVLQQSFVEGLLFLTKAAGVFEGLRAPCLVNSADVANHSSSRQILYVKMPRWWCFYKLTSGSLRYIGTLFSQWYLEYVL